MHTYLITPFAPLVLRTGKPFGETGGGESFPFPLPSTVAGALRTVYADLHSLNFSTQKESILSKTCHGALPAALNATAQVGPLFPRPADARYVKQENGLCLQRLSPTELTGDEGSDLPDRLLPVFLEGNDKSKPAPGPIWWTEQAMGQWLQGDTPDSNRLGPAPPPMDMRTHVALDPATLAADPGRLFQSAGPDFEARRKPPQPDIAANGWESTRYGLVARFSESLRPTMARVGGEGRLSSIAPCNGWPRMPDSLKRGLEKSKSIRIILATPALFSGGWRPGWLDDHLTGSPPGIPEIELRLKAAAVERWQAISGWDLSANWPKAVRRIAPAGSVYWFEVCRAAGGWAEKLWLAPISDSHRDRNDGFGLILPGLWKR